MLILENVLFRCMYFRSKPAINLLTDISFSKSIIVLDEYSCKLKDETEVPCVDLKICLQYNGLDVEENISEYTKVGFRLPNND